MSGETANEVNESEESEDPVWRQDSFGPCPEMI